MKKFTCTGQFGPTVEHTTGAVNCTDTVRDFYFFLLGCSFHKDSVLAAFENIVEEYEEREKDEA